MSFKESNNPKNNYHTHPSTQWSMFAKKPTIILARSQLLVNVYIHNQISANWPISSMCPILGTHWIVVKKLMILIFRHFSFTYCWWIRFIFKSFVVPQNKLIIYVKSVFVKLFYLEKYFADLIHTFRYCRILSMLYSAIDFMLWYSFSNSECQNLSLLPTVSQEWTPEQMARAISKCIYQIWF